MPGSTTIIDWLGSGDAADIPAAATIDALIAPGTFAFFSAEDSGDLYRLNRTTVAWDVVATVGGSGITELTGDGTAGPGSGSQVFTLSDDTVTTAKIVDGAVTEDKIGDGEVTNAKLADMAALTFKANATGSTDAPQDVTAEDAAAILAPYLPGLGLFVLVISKTADYSISAGETGTTFNTTGASMDVTGSLPPSALGLWFRFVVSAADYHKIEADGTETIVWGGDTSAPGGYIRSNVLGSVLRLEAHGTGGWVAIAESGEWGMDV